MKYLSLLLFIFSLSISSFGQVNNWLWAKGAKGYSEGRNVATDLNGNVYSTGTFAGTVVFGTDSIADTTTAVFLVKYDPAGNVLWAKSSAGGNSTPGFNCYDVATDNSGNVYITGPFMSPVIAFGTYTLSNTDNTGMTDDIYLVKFDSLGTVIWAKSAGGVNSPIGYQNDGVYSVSVDGSGNVFITGDFYSDTIKFGGYKLVNAASPSSGSTDVFLAKYDSSGNVQWAKSGVGAMGDGSCSVANDKLGNVFITGNFTSSTIAFGSTIITNSGVQGHSDIFLVKYDALGNVVWARNPGGGYGSGNGGQGIATDSSGNIYVTGYFKDKTVTFGAIVLHNTDSTCLQTDMFLVKYDGAGSEIWAKNPPSMGGECGKSLATDSSNNVYVAGYFYSFNNYPIIFDSYILVPNPPSYNMDAIFIAKYDSSGKVLCATALSSGGDDHGIAADGFGNLYVGGDFGDNGDTAFIIGADTLFCPHLSECFFIAKYHCGGEASVSELSNVKMVSIYPNPTDGKFQLQLAKGKYSVKIYNLLGESLCETEVKLEDQQIDISNLPNGIYLLEVKGDYNTYFSKVVKK